MISTQLYCLKQRTNNLQNASQKDITLNKKLEEKMADANSQKIALQNKSNVSSSACTFVNSYEDVVIFCVLTCIYLSCYL